MKIITHKTSLLLQDRMQINDSATTNSSSVFLFFISSSSRSNQLQLSPAHTRRRSHSSHFCHDFLQSFSFYDDCHKTLGTQENVLKDNLTELNSKCLNNFVTLVY